MRGGGGFGGGGGGGTTTTSFGEPSRPQVAAANLKSELKPYSDNLFAIDDFKTEFSIVEPLVNSSTIPGVIRPGWPAHISLNTNENSTVIDVSSSAGLTAPLRT